MPCSSFNTARIKLLNWHAKLFMTFYRFLVHLGGAGLALDGLALDGLALDGF